MPMASGEKLLKTGNRLCNVLSLSLIHNLGERNAEVPAASHMSTLVVAAVREGVDAQGPNKTRFEDRSLANVHFAT